MRSDFTFIIPNTSWFGKRYWHNYPYTEALLIAALKREGFSVDVIDANINNHDEKVLAERIEEHQPKIVGIGEMALEYKDCVHKTFEIVKKVDPNTKTVIGGIYPTLSPEIATADKHIDYFVFGEGEERLPALIRAIQKNSGFDAIDGIGYRSGGDVMITPRDSSRVVDLDALPLPDYSEFDMDRYSNYQQKFTQNFRFKQLPVGITMTSRGCPYRCTFCSSKTLYGQKIRTRSPEKVLSEVDMLLENYGVKEIIFVDDSLLAPRQRAIEIMDGLIERRKKYGFVWKSNNLAIHHMNDDELLDKMQESGCYQLIVSIESGSENTLKRMKKPVKLGSVIETLKKIKAKNFENVSSNFVIGMPGDTWEDIRECFQFVDDISSDGLLDYAVFHIATPFPETELYQTCKEQKCLPDDFSFTKPEYYGFGRGVISTPEFSPEELQILRAYEWDRINFKTHEKRVKIAEMLGITLSELERWRKETRKTIGLHVQSADMREYSQK